MRTRRQLGIAVAAWFALGIASTAVASSPVTGPVPSTVASNAILRGVVTEEAQGLLLPRVSITLRSETEQGFIRVRATDLQGAFRFDALPAGLYSLEAQYPGFERVTVKPILVLEGTERQEHITLRELRGESQNS